MSSSSSQAAALVLLTAALGLTVGSALADEPRPSANRQRMLQELESLRQKVTDLEAADTDHWLSERRAQEVRSLIAAVLSDAHTRASFGGSGFSAGHDGKYFFLASGDGHFVLNISGQIQTRYTWNHRHPAIAPPDDGGTDGGTGGGEDGEIIVDAPVVGVPRSEPAFDQDEMGFEIPRAKLRFWGHLFSPTVFYELRLAVDRLDNAVVADKIVVGYRPVEGFTIWGGEDKAPFLREELVESSHQLAVERSLLNEVFTVGYVQGLWLQWVPARFMRITTSFNDGFRSGEARGAGGFKAPSFGGGNTDYPGDSKAFDSDVADFGVTGRLELNLAAGDWEQLDDFSAWSGEETALFLGVALHYEVGETGDGQASALDKDYATAGGTQYDRLINWTTDFTYETGGLSLFGAVVGTHIFGYAGADETEHIGAMLQTGLMLVPDKFEPFFRAEWISMADRGALGDQPQDVVILAWGANWYFNRHATKFTMDVLWALDPIRDLNIDQHQIAVTDPTSTGLLFDPDDQADQMAVRAQLQLLF